MKKNEPKLADVRAPWDDPNWGARQLLKPRSLRRVFAYTREFGWFWAPTSIDAWRYRRFLKDLDEVFLRSLKAHGALAARELAEWLNHEKLLWTNPERTGIHRISVATAHDWITLAHRRGLVAPWGEAKTASGGSHWELSRRGREAIRPRIVALVDRLPYASLVPIIAGSLAGALEWLTLHQVVIVAIVYVLFLGLLVAVPSLWTSRSEKRESPGIAVVAIETLRSAGRPIPSLGGG
jgi:hypothetical protein